MNAMRYLLNTKSFHWTLDDLLELNRIDAYACARARARERTRVRVCVLRAHIDKVSLKMFLHFLCFSFFVSLLFENLS